MSRMSRQKGKRVTDKGRIPNAGEVARSLEAKHGGTWRVASTDEYIARKVSEATERGRTIGRLEGIADAFECPWDEHSSVGITAASMRMLAPILRAEIERLKRP